MKSKKTNYYDKIAQKIFRAEKEKCGFDVCDTWIVCLWTSVNGKANVILERKDPDTYCFNTDWYEGGEVKLLWWIPLHEVQVGEWEESYQRIRSRHYEIMHEQESISKSARLSLMTWVLDVLTEARGG